jgi:hypothetical protein
MTKLEIHMAAEAKMKKTMCHLGIRDAKKVLYAAWKLAQAEEKRQKEENKKCQDAKRAKKRRLRTSSTATS